MSTGVRPVQTQRRRVCSALVLRADSSNDPGPGIRRGSATLLGSWLWRRRCQLHAGVYTNRGPTCTSPVRRSLLLFIYYTSSAPHKKNTYTIQDSIAQYKTKYMAYSPCQCIEKKKTENLKTGLSARNRTTLHFSAQSRLLFKWFINFTCT